MLGFFEKIVSFLNEENIPYMLTGSMAMSLYTLSRSTKDFDFVVQLSPDDAIKVMEYFRLGYYCDEASINDAIRRKGMFNIIERKRL